MIGLNYNTLIVIISIYLIFNMIKNSITAQLKGELRDNFLFK